MPPAAIDRPLRFQRFELRPAERVLCVDGQPVPLGGRAFDLLLVLARHAHRVVGKQELLDTVWPGLVVEEHNIATQISTLRKLLGAGAVSTIAGHGYRLTAAPLAEADTAPALPDAAPRDNLPAPRTRFIGREAALAGLVRLLPSTRLLTLTGIGGCGKTRLALQLAQRQRAAFGGGLWFVDLAPLGDASRVAAVCAAVLGLREDGERPLTERLREHLSSRPSLLLLDNCEQVRDGAAALADALLAAAGGCTIVATSREPLGVPGEQVYPVRSLSLPATTDLGAAQASEAVCVFVDRACLAWPEFTLDAANAGLVTEICRRLDGIALAIELAAARVPMLSLAEIATRLDDRFRLLTGGSRSLPRHQTLHAAVRWSYELLSEPEQRLLRQVSVCVGGWTLQAAARLAGDGDEYEVLALLSALRDKSLVEVDRESAPGLARYRMLETVRQFALERLDERGESEPARQRHLAHCLALAQQARSRLRGTEQDLWMGRLRAEHENLIAALRWCIDGPADPQLGLRLAADTHYYWVWNAVDLGRRLVQAVLDRELGAADTVARVDALCALAKLNLYCGRYDESLRHAQQALAIAQRLGSAQATADALAEVGSALTTLQRIDEARAHLEEAVVLARPQAAPDVMAALLNNLAETQRAAGDLAAAEASYREALQQARGRCGRLVLVTLLNNLIRVQVALGQPASARPLAAECLTLVRGEKVGVDLLDAAAGLASAAGAHAVAARLWGSSDQRLREWGYRLMPIDVAHARPLRERSQQALGAAAHAAADAAGRALELDVAVAELERWLAGGDAVALR